VFVFPHPLVNLHKGSRSAAAVRVPFAGLVAAACWGSGAVTFPVRCRYLPRPGAASLPADPRPGPRRGRGDPPRARCRVLPRDCRSHAATQSCWGCPTLRDNSRRLAHGAQLRGGCDFLALPPAHPPCQFFLICIPLPLPSTPATPAGGSQPPDSRRKPPETSACPAAPSAAGLGRPAPCFPEELSLFCFSPCPLRPFPRGTSHKPAFLEKNNLWKSNFKGCVGHCFKHKGEREEKKHYLNCRFLVTQTF